MPTLYNLSVFFSFYIINNTNIQDSEFINKLKCNDPLAQKQLYDRYAAALLSVCRLYIKDAHFAEDALLKAFYKIFTHIQQYKPQQKLYAWMRRITVNECIDFLRSKQQKLIYSDWNDNYDTIDDSALDEATYQEAQIQAFINQLPEGSRMVFNLYVFEDYTHKQIAQTLGINEGTSKSQLAYAKKMLKKYVER